MNETKQKQAEQKQIFRMGIIRKFIVLISGLLFINIVLLGYFLFLNKSVSVSEIENSRLRVIFLNIGQGDAALIQTPAGQNILIDGGPDKKIIYKLDKYIPITNRKIDLMILTHPDPDHLNGLVEVLKRHQVNQVIYNGINDPDPTYLEWKKIIQEKQIPMTIIDKKQILKINEQIILEFIWPQKSLVGQSLKDDNYGSIVSKLIFNQIKFLFTADATKEVEDELIKINENLAADVLKVSHHGSKSSTSLEFLEKVRPKYAVISVGRNNFGHPSFRVLRNLKKIGTQILRTDEKGDIIFISDGEKIKIKTSK
ncbi:MAG: ComEC/Rec2 family competence protein [Minisyncoccia bacterium]